MQVEAAFRRLDLNGDGFIAWDEFQKVFLSLFLSQHPPLSQSLFLSPPLSSPPFLPFFFPLLYPYSFTKGKKRSCTSPPLPPPRTT